MSEIFIRNFLMKKVRETCDKLQTKIVGGNSDKDSSNSAVYISIIHCVPIELMPFLCWQ